MWTRRDELVSYFLLLFRFLKTKKNKRKTRPNVIAAVAVLSHGCVWTYWSWTQILDCRTNPPLMFWSHQSCLQVDIIYDRSLFVSLTSSFFFFFSVCRFSFAHCMWKSVSEHSSDFTWKWSQRHWRQQRKQGQFSVAKTVGQTVDGKLQMTELGKQQWRPVISQMKLHSAKRFHLLLLFGIKFVFLLLNYECCRSC